MPKVWVLMEPEVTYSEYTASSAYIVGVFSSEALAKKYVRKYGSISQEITEHELDPKYND